MLVKTVIDKETVDHKGDPKIVFIMEDDTHGLYQTDVVLDPLHRAFIDTKQVALIDVLKPILLARFDSWIKVKDEEAIMVAVGETAKTAPASFLQSGTEIVI